MEITFHKSSTEELEKNYREALQNKDFAALVNYLHLTKEEAMKKTTKLLATVEELNHCKKCHGLYECQNAYPGHVGTLEKSEEGIFATYKPCKYQKKEWAAKESKKSEEDVSLKARMKDIDVKDKNRIEVIKWLDQFYEQYDFSKTMKGLYLHGNFGCGKTYLIAATFNELAKDGIKSAIVFWPEFLNSLKSSFNSEVKSEFKNKYNYVKKVPILLIDDLGAESVTSWARDEILCPLLQYRMDEKLPTFFTSNLNLDNLEKHLAITSKGDEIIKAGRIISRIKQLTEYQELISKNLRK